MCRLYVCILCLSFMGGVVCGAGVWCLVGANGRLAGWRFCSTPWNAAGMMMMMMMTLFIACVH